MRRTERGGLREEGRVDCLVSNADPWGGRRCSALRCGKSLSFPGITTGMDKQRWQVGPQELTS